MTDADTINISGQETLLSSGDSMLRGIVKLRNVTPMATVEKPILTFA
jgi:hypothetical protein